jgi:hypothetical protein
MSIMIYVLAPLFLKSFMVRVRGIVVSYKKNLRERLKAEIIQFILVCVVGLSLFILLR